MKMIHVILPSEKSAYTLYAEGNFISSNTYNNKTSLIFNADYPLVLFYTFQNHRRIYLCIHDPKGNKFPGIKENLRIVAQIRGRAFDRYKRSLDYLNKEFHGTIQYFPLEFFWVLSVICKKGNNNSLCLRLLYDKYRIFLPMNLVI